MTIFRGAPFDKNNLFNRAAVDGGTLVYENDTSFSMIEGGSFTQSQPYQNAGLLPKQGTATYIPDPNYGPFGPIQGS
jgi:hypothetical protein|tara:strand:+ start:351 stop:581 length:231 start_codon:yes stop_codon:yes gene_type:complete